MTYRNQLAGFTAILFATDAAAASGAVAAKPVVKTVIEDMDSRRIFTNVAETEAYLNMCAETFSDFADIPFAAPGVSAEGEFDSKVYTPDMAIMVAVLRKVAKGSIPGGVKAIVVTPVPTLTGLLANDSGKDWVAKIIQKELNHVAVRALREAEDVSTVVDQMPTTQEAYISSAREGGGIVETFNELFKPIKATLAAKVPVWAKANLPKNELKRAMESKAYADEYYPSLEAARPNAPDGLFVVALGLGITVSKLKGLDPTIFQRWLDTRNAKAFTPAETEDEDFDMAGLTDSLLAEDKPAAAATTEAPATVGTAATT